jgi:hypothetical protein
MEEDRKLLCSSTPALPTLDPNRACGYCSMLEEKSGREADVFYSDAEARAWLGPVPTALPRGSHPVGAALVHCLLLSEPERTGCVTLQ